MSDPQHLKFQGKSSPMTVITAIRPGTVLFVKLTLWLIRTFNIGLDVVKALRFIHYAQWTVLDPQHFANSCPEQRTDLLRRKYFLFSTNYNGPWDQYIDSFSLVNTVRDGVNWLWACSAQFTWSYPVRPFKRYIRYHEYPVDAYFNAYPEATIRDVEAALEVSRQLQELKANYRENVRDIPTGPPLQLFINTVLLAPIGHLPVMSAAKNEQLLTLMAEFEASTAQYMGGTKRERTPTMKGADGPDGLQI